MARRFVVPKMTLLNGRGEVVAVTLRHESVIISFIVVRRFDNRGRFMLVENTCSGKVRKEIYKQMMREAFEVVKEEST